MGHAGTACNFNAIILNQSILNCLITSASTLIMHGKSNDAWYCHLCQPRRIC